MRVNMRASMLALALMGCDGAEPSEPVCIDDLPEACTPQYAPTFDEVWQNTLSPSCAVSGCHGGGSASGGLSLEDIETAYDSLLDGLVEPSSAACSQLVFRLEPVAEGNMPPGNPLDEAERCSVRQWIDEGASR